MNTTTAPAHTDFYAALHAAEAALREAARLAPSSLAADHASRIADDVYGLGCSAN